MKVHRSPVSTDRRFKRSNQMRPDHGSSYRWQHSRRIMVSTDNPRAPAVRAMEWHVAKKLLIAGIITADMYHSARRLAYDWHAARLAPRITSQYNKTQFCSSFAYTEFERNSIEEAAYERWRNAISSIPIKSRDVTTRVICQGQSPSSSCETDDLIVGLGSLTKHYSYATSFTRSVVARKLLA